MVQVTPSSLITNATSPLEDTAGARRPGRWSSKTVRRSTKSKTLRRSSTDIANSRPCGSKSHQTAESGRYCFRQGFPAFRGAGDPEPRIAAKPPTSVTSSFDAPTKAAS